VTVAMRSAAPGDVPPWTLVGVYAAMCWMRAFQFGSMIWNEHGISFTSLLYTFLFGCLIFGCAMPAFLLVTWVDRRTALEPLHARVWKLAAALGAGAIVFGVAIVAIEWAMGWVDEGELSLFGHVTMFALWILTMGGVLTAILVLARYEARMAARLHDENVAAARRRREWDEIRLRFLRSQIEPHFLFNALANVKRLYETQPSSGRDLLRSIADYLELALSTGRMGCRTVADELALTRAYLDIFAVRMGERLRVELDVPEELRAAPMPPLMLGTLVENALKHGIGPRAQGGKIRIEIRREGPDLVARVSDDGLGFRDASGSGVGLSNTRARLSTLFGDRGRLDLGRNPGGGVVATLRLPLEATP
jgi:signal transduction histidine kinase